MLGFESSVYPPSENKIMSDADYEWEDCDFEQYCRHWQDLESCNKLCDNCNDSCYQHTSNNDECLRLFCKCTSFVDKKIK